MFIVLITKSYDKSVWCNFSVHCHIFMVMALMPIFGVRKLPIEPLVEHGIIIGGILGIE